MQIYSFNILRLLLPLGTWSLGHKAVMPRASENATNTTSGPRWPHIVPLLRESIPVIHKGETVSHRTSYSGLVSIGYPAQEFRVVFDTGSGHVVVPSSNCKNETCLVHRQYNISKSETATAINVDGTPVLPDEVCDQVTIGYGTGKVTGEFARDEVCLGGDQDKCVNVSVVMAVAMTNHPFQSFKFDGVFGLGLENLAVSPEFSFFNRLTASDPTVSLQFGVFLVDGVHGPEGSEIALGGYNDKHLLSPLQWAPVARKTMGYWQVEIKEVRIGNRTMDVCRDGSCRGVVDTGTSHLGVPGPHLNEFTRILTIHDVETSSCRGIQGPDVELVLDGITLTLSPENYMRPLSIPTGVNLGSATGASLTSVQEGGAPGSAAEHAAEAGDHSSVSRRCAPRLMAVNLPAPLGPSLFILGEPVLHRYYTVFDWKEKRIGFGLAGTVQNQNALQSPEHQHQDGEDTVFMQVRITLRLGRALRAGKEGSAAARGVSFAR